jgi:hypothetical protein
MNRDEGGGVWWCVVVCGGVLVNNRGDHIVSRVY